MPPNALPVAFPRPNCPSLLSSLPARKSNHPWVCRLPFTLESALVPNYSRWAFCLCFSLQPGAFVLSKRRRKKPFPRRAEHRCREVLRALNAGRCHLPASLKRYLANLISCPKNGPGSCSRSRQPCCLPACLPRQSGARLGKLLPPGFWATLAKELSAAGHGVPFALEVSSTGRCWRFCRACFSPASPNAGGSELLFVVEVGS